MRWDLIIVGAGPAGTSTALHLLSCYPQMAGRILILEKDRFPREKYCAGGLGQRALKRLARIGVYPDVPMVPVERVEMRTPHHQLFVEEPNFGVVVRRIEFDHFLAKEAVKRGAFLREGAKVTELRPVGGGMELKLEDGETLEARAVVGADGVAGTVRRSLGLSGGVYRAQVLELDTEPAEGDPPRNTLRFDASWMDFQGYAWDFPTLVKGEEKVCRGMYLIRTRGEGNVKERLSSYLSARGLDIRNYRLKPFGERGFSPTETLSKPGCLLVGEAAGIDIATGEGIAQAIAYGALAAAYLDRSFHAGNLDFRDWSRIVRESGLGRNLLARLIMYASFYGEPSQRRFTENLLQQNQYILQAFARGFSGRGLDSALIAAIAMRMPQALASGLNAYTNASGL